MRKLNSKDLERLLEGGESVLEVEVSDYRDLFGRGGFGYTKRSVGGEQRYFVLKLLSSVSHI